MPRFAHSSTTLPRWAPVLLLFLALSACQQEAPQPPPPAAAEDVIQQIAARDAVVRQLQSVNEIPFRKAFALLPAYSYTRYVRTEQFDAEDYTRAYEESLTRYTRGGASPAQVLEQETAGTFDFGMFSRFVSQHGASLDPVEVNRYLMPSDPVYLAPRNLEAFFYRQLPDTLLWDQVAQVIEVKARPEAGDGLNIRRARFYIQPETQILMAMYLERIDLGLLFREESTFFTHVRPTSRGDWVPYNTRFQTKIRTPFRQPQHFRTVATYSDFE